MNIVSIERVECVADKWERVRQAIKHYQSWLMHVLQHLTLHYMIIFCPEKPQNQKAKGVVIPRDFSYIKDVCTWL